MQITLKHIKVKADSFNENIIVMINCDLEWYTCRKFEILYNL